jgi:hypothetical protein
MPSARHGDSGWSAHSADERDSRRWVHQPGEQLSSGISTGKPRWPATRDGSGKQLSDHQHGQGESQYRCITCVGSE